MIFVDTSAWAALADAHDRDNASARSIFKRLASGEFGRAVTSNYVQAETLTLIRMNLGHEKSRQLATLFETSQDLRTVWIEPVHHREAIRMLLQHDDKEWSVVDCTSFVVMRGLGIRLAFSYDSDFIQAGFQSVS